MAKLKLKPITCILLSAVTAMSVPVAHAAQTAVPLDGTLWKKSAKQNEVQTQPGMNMVDMPMVSVDEADRAMRSRVVPKGLVVDGTGKKSESLTSLAVASPLAPASIAELARALKNNPDLIYEYVRNNIDYYPSWGIQKGAVGALLDNQGTAFDQAALMVALLRQAGYTASFVKGGIKLNATQFKDWTGADTNNICGVSSLLGAAQIPVSALYYSGTTVPSCPNTPTPMAQVNMSHVWVKVNIGGTNYYFDPSYKPHTQKTGIDLVAATGYSATTYLTNAKSGATLTTDYIQNVNRTNIRNDLTTYSNNLANYLRNNKPAAVLEDVVGGKIITPYTGGALRQTSLPYQDTAVAITEWTDIPASYSPTLRVQYQGIDKTLTSDAIYGKRLSITYNASSQPVLMLDGVVQATGTAVTAGTVGTVTFTVTHGAYANTSANQTFTQSIKAGGTFVVGNGWGPTGRGLVEQHRKNLENAKAAGGAEGSEAVLGSSLSILSANWLAQVNQADYINDQLAKTTTLFHHQVGIAGYNNSAYVDLPGNLLSVVSRTADANKQRAVFFNAAMHSSIFESTAVQQTTSTSAVSTVKLIDQAASSGIRIYNATSANYTSAVQPNLTSCSSYTSAFQSVVNAGRRLILPANCSLTEGSWTGTGYFDVLSSSSSWSLGAIINGGGATLGGFSTAPTTTTTTNTIAYLSSISPTSLTVSSGTFFGDPIDMVNGGYLYSRNDITAGTGEFPMSLGFQKLYSSAIRNQDSPLGKGWTHNLAASATVNSDGMQALGEDSALDAVSTIVEKMVSLDLLSDSTMPLDKMVVATIGQRWYGDQLINNTVVVKQGLNGEVFVKLPDGTYNAPPGNSAKLIKNADSTYTYDTVNHAQMNFNSAGKVANYVHPSGLKANFTYTGNDLTQVSNSLGRTLVLTNTGGRITQVADGTRTVKYAFDANANLSTFTDEMGQKTTYQYDVPGRMTKLFYPTAPTTAFLTNTYDTLGRVKTQTNVFGKIYDYYFAGARSEEVGPGGVSRVSYLNSAGKTTKSISPENRIVLNTYDGHNRLVSTTLPEGNSINYTYDDAPCAATAQKRCTHNVKTVTQIAKAGSGIANLVTTNTYESSFNKVASVTDPLGKVTSFTYTAQGLPNTATYPTDSSGVSPVTTYGYTAYTPTGWPTFYLQTSVTSKTSSTNNVVSSTVFDANNKYVPSTTTVDSGTGKLNITSTFTYDSFGNLTKVDGPRSDVTDVVNYSYDNARRVTQTTDAAGKVTKNTYDAGGRLIRTATQVGTQWLVSCSTYSNSDKPTKTWGPALTTADTTCPTAAAPVPVTDYAYDDLDRTIRVTQNLTTAEGGNRVTETVYNKDDSIKTVKQAVGTTLAQEYANYTYTNNGQVATIKDAKGNLTTYEYDGHDRKVKTRYPDKVTAGASSTTDYEQYSYDANGNLTSLRKRSGNSIGMSYDNLNRLTARTYPTTEAANNQVYTYDLLGRRLTTNYSNGSYGISYVWDNAGRVTSTTAGGRQLSYQYDQAGNRTRITWPEATNGLYVTTSYDALNRPTAIKENGTTTLASYSYDDLSRRTNATLGNGAVTSYSYDNQGGLSSLGHNLEGTGTAKDITWSYSRNQAMEISSHSWNNDLYQWAGYSNGTKNYTSNALNQYTAAAGATISNDSNGNLSGDGTWTYSYNSDNRLIGASKTGTTATLAYDPEGRLRQTAITTASAVTTNFAYDGSDLVAEYDASNNPLRRYVHGPGTDEPIVWYEGTGLTNKSYFHADHLGSIVSTTNSAGTSTATYTYGPYGEPNTTTGSRFRYTGQLLIGDLNLYYYKARFYSPSVGRFLQTDPIGYGDGLNWYAYVGNNPVNGTDPSGEVALWDNIVAGGANAAIGFGVSCLTSGCGSYGLKNLAVDFGVGFATNGLAVIASAKRLENVYDAARSGRVFSGEGGVYGKAQITGGAVPDVDHAARSIFEAQKMVSTRGGASYLDESVRGLGIQGTARNYRPDVTNIAGGRVSTVEVASKSQASGAQRSYLTNKQNDIQSVLSVEQRGTTSVIEYGSAAVGRGEVFNAFYRQNVAKGLAGYQGFSAATASGSAK